MTRSPVLQSINDEQTAGSEQPGKHWASENFANAFEKARGDYLVLVSDDNLLDPAFLEKCVRLVRQEPDIPIVLAAYRHCHTRRICRESRRRIVPAVTRRSFRPEFGDGTELLKSISVAGFQRSSLSSVIRTDFCGATAAVLSSIPCAGDDATWIPLLLEGQAGLSQRTVRHVSGAWFMPQRRDLSADIRVQRNVQGDGGDFCHLPNGSFRTPPGERQIQEADAKISGPTRP